MNKNDFIKMSKEERSSTIGNYKTKCLCDDCPTYNDCARGRRELLYCLTERSLFCIKGEGGCICPSCPVTAQIGLTQEYYCIIGSEETAKKSSPINI